MTAWGEKFSLPPVFLWCTSWEWFFLLKWLGQKSKEEQYFMTLENYMTLKFQCPFSKDLLENRHASIFMYRLWLLFHSSGTVKDRDHITHKAQIFTIWPLYRQCFLTPGLEERPCSGSTSVLILALSPRDFVTLGRWLNVSRSCFYS